MTSSPLVRIVEAGLGVDAQIRVALSDISDPDGLRSAWSSSGATIENRGTYTLATTTAVALARAAGRSLPLEEAKILERRLHRALSSWTGSPPAWNVRKATLCSNERPLIMGILNVTPDSFYDGGRYTDGHPASAIDAARALVEAGADIVDIGGESTRPGADPVPIETEIARVMPVVRALASDGVTVSIDTRKSEVAKRALTDGASIVNDVSGAVDPEVLSAVARAGAGYVLMHTRGTPKEMQKQTEYDDVVHDVYSFLCKGLQVCEDAGIAPENIALDPGIGFAKTAEQSYQLIHAVRQFTGLERPVLVGASRKSFLELATGVEAPSGRLFGSVAIASHATALGAAILRVHDVAETLEAVKTVRTTMTGNSVWPDAVTK